jgi:muramoyltetrapeptide carboxypeptidase
MTRRIGICAPSTAFAREDAARVTALAVEHAPSLELIFSDQCFVVEGHFAGPDSLRRDAFVAMANDPALDAIWFVRGGYGAARMAEDAIALLEAPAAQKVYMGYSDGGVLLAGLYRAGVGKPVHGPMPTDIRRTGGEAAVIRSLRWFAERASEAVEPSLEEGRSYAAFNLMTLSMLIGTSLMPDLSGHILLVEEVSEYDYAFDRAMFHVTNALSGAGLAGLRLGRVSDVVENDRPFGHDHEAIAHHWCSRAGIAYLGRADIGHDAANRIVPFGRFSR